MFHSFHQYGKNAPLPKYTEIGPDGSILCQSNHVPAYVSTIYLQPNGIVHRNLMDMMDLRTSDYYRTFDIPDRFNRPDIWQGYRKFELHPFYRTENQEYGAHKPEIHTMPNGMSIGGNFRRSGFNTSTTSTVSKYIPRGTRPI
ncbi:unnamed protein product [Rotaria sp. Silwood1]|nr:unnamed protein product [Rotaria sp. Silwood1]